MRGWQIAWVIGILFGWTVQGAAQTVRLLKEIPMEEFRSQDTGHFISEVTIPKVYGHLVSVTVSSGVHYLYFEDEKGTIRIVLVGPSSKAQDAQSTDVLNLLSRDVYSIDRGDWRLKVQ